MPTAPEFSDAELYRIKEMLIQHYQKDIQMNLVNFDAVLSTHDKIAATCPAIYWHAHGTNFVVSKTGLSEYRGLFYYTPHELFEIGTDGFDNIEECVTAVLQTQGDNRRQSTRTH